MPLLSRICQLKKSRHYNVVSKHVLMVQVHQLDGTAVECSFMADSSGLECLQSVCQRFGIKQSEYFGLQCVSTVAEQAVAAPEHAAVGDHQLQQRRWLELERPLRQQLHKHAASTHLHLAVLYYVTDVNSLHDPATRRQFYLQLRSDLLDGKLHASYEQAVMLASYYLQLQLGNFDGEQHSLHTLSQLPLFPRHMVDDAARKETLVQAAWEAHASLRGLSQQLAEVYFIMEVQQLEGYGQQHFFCCDGRGDDCLVGVSLTGIVVRRLHSAQVCSHYRWQHIANLHNERRQFAVELAGDGVTHRFSLADKALAKYVWKICVQQHKFFKLQSALSNESRAISSQLPMPDIQAITHRSSSHLPSASRKSSDTIGSRPATSSAGMPAIKSNSVGGLLDTTSGATRTANEPTKAESTSAPSAAAVAALATEQVTRQSARRQLGVSVSSDTVSGQSREAECCSERSAGVSSSGAAGRQVALSPSSARKSAQHLVYGRNSTGIQTHSSVYGNFSDLSRLVPPEAAHQALSHSTPMAALTFSTPELASCGDQPTITFFDHHTHHHHHHHLKISRGLSYFNGGCSSSSNNNNHNLYPSPDPVTLPALPAPLHQQLPPPPYPYGKVASVSTPNLLHLECVDTANSPDLITSSTRHLNNNNNSFDGGGGTNASSSVDYLWSPLATCDRSDRLPARLVMSGDTSAPQGCVKSDEPSLVYRVGSMQSADCRSCCSSSSARSHQPATVHSVSQPATVHSVSQPAAVEHIYENLSPTPSQSQSQLQLQSQLQSQSRPGWSRQSGGAPLGPERAASPHTADGPPSWVQRASNDNSTDGRSSSSRGGGGGGSTSPPPSVPRSVPRSVPPSVQESRWKWHQLLPAQSSGVGAATFRRLKKTLALAGRATPSARTSSSSCSATTNSSSATSAHSATAVDSFTMTGSRQEQCHALRQRMSGAAFRDEFESVMTRRPAAEFTTATRVENLARNRFPDILPYEDNRVRVAPSRGNPSGYINASHISVSVGDRQCFYLAAQSPMAASVTDFWRAVWAHQVAVVVMLAGDADCAGGGGGGGGGGGVGEESELGATTEPVCLDYWPRADGEYCVFGDSDEAGAGGAEEFEVLRRVSTHGSAHVTSQLVLTRRHRSTAARYPSAAAAGTAGTHASGAGGSARTVWHVQYTDWPSTECARQRGRFIDLLQEVNALAAAASGGGPVLVHCATGVGRTGVVIAAHVLLHCVDHNAPLHPARLLGQLRHQRMLLVPTLDHYRLVYQVLGDYLGGSRLI